MAPFPLETTLERPGRSHTGIENEETLIAHKKDPALLLGNLPGVASRIDDRSKKLASAVAPHIRVVVAIHSLRARRN
jgi:hypothetical protein